MKTSRFLEIFSLYLAAGIAQLYKIILLLKNTGIKNIRMLTTLHRAQTEYTHTKKMIYQQIKILQAWNNYFSMYPHSNNALSHLQFMFTSMLLESL